MGAAFRENCLSEPGEGAQHPDRETPNFSTSTTRCRTFSLSLIPFKKFGLCHIQVF